MNIERVEIKNFKSLKDIDIELKNLTLLTGINSTGKSSFIQALLLMKQNQFNLEKLLYYNIPSKKIYLISDGEYISLGNIEKVLYEDTFQEDISIKLFSNKDSIHITFNKNMKTSYELKEYKNINLFYDDFQYIMTDRIAPQTTYGLSDEKIRENLIGHQGEYVAHYLDEKKNKNLFLENLKHINSKTNQLIENVSLWLGEISSNINIDTVVYRSLNQVKLTYQYTYGERKSNNYSPLNVGFGVTYVLPIIVSILKSKPGDLLIIENPESHLHPAGQSKIAELCSIAAANGVQIIVETHSEHFLNGLRVATKKGIIDSKDSNIYYFRKEVDSLATKINKLNIDKYGNINDWPDGFFDEWDKKLDDLLGI